MVTCMPQDQHRVSFVTSSIMESLLSKLFPTMCREWVDVRRKIYKTDRSLKRPIRSNNTTALYYLEKFQCLKRSKKIKRPSISSIKTYYSMKIIIGSQTISLRHTKELTSNLLLMWIFFQGGKVIKLNLVSTIHRRVLIPQIIGGANTNTKNRMD